MTSRLVLGLLLAVASCSSHADPSATGGSGAVAPTIKKDPALARRLIGEGAAVIDVRTADEFAQGHVERAVNIPIEELANRMPEVGKLASKDQPIVVYCGSGFRAGKAQRELIAAGYSQVVNGGSLNDVKSP